MDNTPQEFLAANPEGVERIRTNLLIINKMNDSTPPDDEIKRALGLIEDLVNDKDKDSRELKLEKISKTNPRIVELLQLEKYGRSQLKHIVLYRLNLSMECLSGLTKEQVLTIIYFSKVEISMFIG